MGGRPSVISDSQTHGVVKLEKLDENLATSYERSEKIQEEDLADATYSCKCWNVEDRTQFLMRNIAKDRKYSAKEVQTEVEMLRQLEHPNITKLHGYFTSPRWHHLVQDYTYESYLSRLQRGKRVSRKHQSLVILQTTLAITYLHDLKIVHGALSTESIRFVYRKSSAEIKISNFMFATYAPEPVNILNPNLMFASPEMLKVNNMCHYSSDWWAMGAILFEIAYGYSPFEGRAKSAQFFENVRQGNINFPHDPRNLLEESLMDLVSKLLIVDSRHRGNDSHIMMSNWMLHFTSNDDESDDYLESKRRCPRTCRPPSISTIPLSDSDFSSDEEFSSDSTSHGGTLSSTRSSAISSEVVE